MGTVYAFLRNRFLRGEFSPNDLLDVDELAALKEYYIHMAQICPVSSD
jgi:hypothetical protein